MRISTFISLLVVIGAIFFIYASMVSDTSLKYNVNINTSQWNSSYDYAMKVNKSVGPIQDAFNTITDENTGWFTKLTAGIMAIPQAIIALPVLVFSSFSMGGNILTGFFLAFGLPAYLLTVSLILLIVWGLFKLGEIFQRWQL